MAEDDDLKDMRRLNIVGHENAVESAPVIYIDGMQGLTFGIGPAGGMVKINLYVDVQDLSVRPTDEATFTRRVVARLVMPPQALIAVSNWLAPKAEDLKQHVEKLFSAKDEHDK